MSDQINVNSGGRRDSGAGTLLAVVLVIALVAFLVWAIAFGGFNAVTGGPDVGVAPATGAPANSGDTNINVKPDINVQPSGNNAPTGGNTKPANP